MTLESSPAMDNELRQNCQEVIERIVHLRDCL